MEKSINAELIINEYRMQVAELSHENMLMKAYVKQLEAAINQQQQQEK